MECEACALVMCTSPLNNVSNSALEGKPEDAEKCYSSLSGIPNVEVKDVAGFMLLLSFLYSFYRLSHC